MAGCCGIVNSPDINPTVVRLIQPYNSTRYAGYYRSFDPSFTVDTFIIEPEKINNQGSMRFLLAVGAKRTRSGSVKLAVERVVDGHHCPRLLLFFLPDEKWLVKICLISLAVTTVCFTFLYFLETNL
jgi:hypothetical protein